MGNLHLKTMEEAMALADRNVRELIQQAEWDELRAKLLDMDAHGKPRVVVSVLMLREGFDANNICVIVPLRTTGAKILLEQIVGRGLRLMWRENEFESQKKDNRDLIRAGQEPKSMIDVLSIVEHPKFAEFYEQLRKDGYEFAEASPTDTGKKSTGDLTPVGLRDGYEKFDFAIPSVMRDREEEIVQQDLDVMTLPVSPLPDDPGGNYFQIGGQCARKVCVLFLAYHAASFPTGGFPERGVVEIIYGGGDSNERYSGESEKANP